SAADGSFALEEHASGARVEAREPDLVTLVPGEEAELARPASWVVVVAPRASFAGHVRDPAGAPVPDARVRFGLREALFRELGLRRRAHEGTRAPATTDAEGAFAVPDVAGGERVYLQVEAEGFWLAEFDLPEASTSDLVLTLERDSGGRIVTGIVLDPGGAPVSGARVSAGDGIVTSDAEGRFE